MCVPVIHQQFLEQWHKSTESARQSESGFLKRNKMDAQTQGIRTGIHIYSGTRLMRSPLGQNFPGCFTQVAVLPGFSLIFMIRRLYMNINEMWSKANGLC